MNLSIFKILNESKELVCLIKDKSDENQIKDWLSENQTFNLTTVIKNDENKEQLEEIIPFIKNYPYINDKSTYYLCKEKSCLAPVNDINELKTLW